MRIVLVSYDADGFRTIHGPIVRAGHEAVAYVHALSARPGHAPRPDAAGTVAGIVRDLPAGTDLLLPGGTGGLAASLAGHRPDLLVVNGFPWLLPPPVLRIPRLGAINIHPSLLPRHRGPMPVHWAIRNGEPETGVTVHRMDASFDTGAVLARRGGVALPDDLDRGRLAASLDRARAEALAEALEKVCAGDGGVPQDDGGASYAGWMEPAFLFVDWSRTVREVHNQVRTYRFGMAGARGPRARIGRSWLTVLRTATRAVDGALRVDCADGPIWIVEHEPASGPLL